MKPTRTPCWFLPIGAVRRSLKGGPPVQMPNKTPACFDSKEQYRKYKTLAQLTASESFTFCTDCTPEYRDEMHQQGRCKFPGTTFTRNNGVITGRQAK